MPLEVIDRPEKDLPNGIYSRFNGSRTPLNYKFKSDLYPTNTIDTQSGMDRCEYNQSKLATFIETTTNVSNLNISVGDYVLIDGTGTSLDGGIFKVKEIPSGSLQSLFISSNFTGTYNGSGTIIRHYKGYKALARVYVGSPSYHTYFNDGSKPEYLAGTLEVEFDSNNEGIGNVRQFVKPDINSEFDDTSENSHNLWTSFYIEYSETWDNKQSGAPNWTRDTLPNCDLFTNFNDPIFENPLGVDWFNNQSGSSVNWVHVGDAMEVDFSPSDFISSVLYQNKKVYPNSKYEIDLNIVTSNQEESFVVFVYDEKNTYLNIQTFKGNSSLKLSISPNSISDLVGFVIRPNGYNTSGTVTLNDANISLVGSGNQCDWSSFAIFGTKQFQDSLGGNFGDYMLNIVDNDVTPKMLTHFDTITLFPENSFILPDGSNRTFYYELKGYFNALIPSSTFYLSDGGNNLFLEFNTFDSLGNSIDSYRQKVENKDDGIYTIDFFGQSGFVEFDNGYAQFIIIPANKLVDGDGGTYDDNFPANWNITPIDIGNSINSVFS